MSKRKINLEEILNSKIPQRLWNEGFSFGDVKEEWVLKAMKESCRQALGLAAENAEVRVTENALIEEGSCYTSYDDNVITVMADKQSILNTINLIE